MGMQSSGLRGNYQKTSAYRDKDKIGQTCTGNKSGRCLSIQRVLYPGKRTRATRVDAALVSGKYCTRANVHGQQEWTLS